MKTFEDYGIDLQGKSGQIKVPCPRCGNEHPKRTDLSVNTIEGTWNCKHPKCSWSGGLGGGNSQWAQKTAKIYSLPKDTAMTLILPDNAIEWFAKRGISKDTIESERIGFKKGNDEWVCFPFYRDEKLINVKYRKMAEKDHRMSPGSELIFYRLDCIAKHEEIIITEGEPDALALVECGYDNVISVPNGSSGKFDSAKMSYFENAQELFKGKKIILAGDNDEAGKSLMEELSRRFGKVRCSVVSWSDDCKDANDVLIRHGKETVRSCIEQKKHYPIEGILSSVDISEEFWEMRKHGTPKGLSTGFNELDKYWTVRKKELVVFTGKPQDGKTTTIRNLVFNLATMHKLKFAIYSPESRPLCVWQADFAETFCGKNFFRLSDEEMVAVETFCHEFFKYLLPVNNDCSLDSMLGLLEATIIRHGTDICIIDPWNCLDHSKRDAGVPETEFIGWALNKITGFMMSHDVAFWVVCHPKKLEKVKKQYDVADVYDLMGSSNWANKADDIITVWRSDTDVVEWHIKKVRSKWTGKRGKVKVVFNTETNTYTEMDILTTHFIGKDGQ
jgi:twinkle protein